MTVAEVIERLERMPSNMQVLIVPYIYQLDQIESICWIAEDERGFVAMGKGSVMSLKTYQRNLGG